MSTSRYMLRVDQLWDFRKFCEAYGWEVEPIKATYEVLRMSKKGSPALIVHRRLHELDFLTVHGSSHEFAKLFAKACKQREEAKG